jgi:Superinfection immunity protein
VNGIKITGIFVRPVTLGISPAAQNRVFPDWILQDRLSQVHRNRSNLKRPTMLAYPSFSAASATSIPAIANSWLIGCSLVAIYFAPALVAFFRRQQNRWFILAPNFLFGWTIVGWIICLAWAARAPAGEPVVVVQTVPPVPPRPITLFRRRPKTHFTPPSSSTLQSIPFQTQEVFPERRPQSFKRVLFRLAVAAISLAIVVTASQWKDANPLRISHPNHRNNHVPQIRNIDPYVPSPSNAAPKRHYPSMPARSHEGYY